MASFELTGKLKTVMETQTFSSGFTKREFVVTTDEQYPQDIKFELIKEKTSVIDSYKEGDTLKVSFNVRGNEYNGKYYVNLQAWRVEADQNAGAPIPPPLDPMAEMPSASATAPATSIDDIGEDDLPF
ncbi:MAG: DUF3127 domain-containing protein [Flavobacteriales bacterium]|nr:DUF3127 domain-containing protein [Flavobacteriales bacterium]